MHERVVRISITLPQTLYREFEKTTKAIGYRKRSKAMGDAVRKFVDDYKLLNQIDAQKCAGIVTYTYDDLGNLTGYDDGVTSGVYVYDPAGRKVSETVNYGSFTKTHGYVYLKNGLKESFTGPDNVAYTYLYDTANRLAGVQIPGAGFITVNKPFDPDGQFPIVEAKNGNFMISVVQSLNKAPVITLEIADPAKKEAK